MLEEIKKRRLEEKLSPLIREEEKLNEELLTDEELEKVLEEKQKIDKLRESIRNNFLKMIFQRQKYEELVKRLNDIYEIKTKQKDVRMELENLKRNKEKLQRAYDSINSMEELLNDDEIGFDVHLSDLSLIQKSYQILRDYCNENGIEFLLDKEEWKSIQDKLYKRANMADFGNIKKSSENGIESMKSYVLVHKTEYLPVNNKIVTPKESDMEYNSIIIDRIGSIQFKSARNTIHFSVNGEVGSHGFGNWNNCKYAILIPFKNIPVNQLRCSVTVDTFIEGGLKLPETAYFLCPEDEIEIVKKNNPNINVIGYKGKTVSGVADLMVSMLGYKLEIVSNFKWINSKDQETFKEDLSQSGLNVREEWHMYTKEKFEEDYFNQVNLFMAFLKKIVDEKIELNEEEINELSSRFSSSLDKNSIQKDNYLKYSKIFYSYIVNFLESYGINITKQISAFFYELSNLLDGEILDERRNVNKQLFILIFNSVNEYIKDNSISRKM